MNTTTTKYSTVLASRWAWRFCAVVATIAASVAMLWLHPFVYLAALAIAGLLIYSAFARRRAAELRRLELQRLHDAQLAWVRGGRMGAFPGSL